MSTSIPRSRQTRDSFAPKPATDVIQFSGDFRLLTGELCSKSQIWHEEQREEGLRIFLVQSGRVRSRVPGQGEHIVNGPSLFCLAHKRAYSTHQIYYRDTPVRYVIVHLAPEAIEQDTALLSRLPRARGADPAVRTAPASANLLALAAQIASCPLQCNMRRLYLSGKALELAALSVEWLAADHRQNPGRMRLAASDVERVHAARDILFHSLQDPPTLQELAARVGTNARKLTAGFRQIFGHSAFALLTEHRLQLARDMLCDGDANVSTIAHRVGFSAAHLSVAFRKRYGVAPSQIRAT